MSKRQAKRTKTEGSRVRDTSKTDRAVRGTSGTRSGVSKAKPKPVRTENRQSATVQAIQRLNGESATFKEVAAIADGIYAKAGGKSNLKEALWATRIAANVMQAMGVIDVDKQRIIPRSCALAKNKVRNLRQKSLET